MSDRDTHNKSDEELHKIFSKGADFTQELLKENGRLRFKIAELAETNRQMELVPANLKDEDFASIEEEIRKLEKEQDELLEKFGAVEEENREFARRYVEIEEENNNLANLYICSYQLHSTLDFKEVLQIIIEIIINLIGAEQFAVLLMDGKIDTLNAVATEGIEQSLIPTLKIGQGVIGEVAQSGESRYVKEIASPSMPVTPLNPLVAIPLKIKEQVIGVIAIYKFLQQKTSFASVDYELFTLLAGHAATAIFSSKLYSESERKLSTIQGFMSLLTK